MRTERSHDSGHDPSIMGTEAPRLRALSRLDDYEVANGDPDIRGWTVFDTRGNGVGIVHDLMIDMGTLEARYMDVELRDLADAEERHVLLPIGMASLSRDVEALTVPNVTKALLASLPTFDHGLVTRDRECELIGAILGSARPAADLGPVFYSQPHFDSTRFWGGRARNRDRVYVVALRSDQDRAS